MRSQYEDIKETAAAGRPYRDRTIRRVAGEEASGGAAAPSSPAPRAAPAQAKSAIASGRAFARPIAAAAATLIAALLVLAPAAARAQAQAHITLANAAHILATVTVGKSQDVHTDRSFTDITVSNPEIADINPLTDHSLSILGKKIGTTRVTAYDQDKKPVGIFDVEVSYDVSQLAAEIARFAGGGIKVSAVNGRILLSGTAPDAVTVDKAVMLARQFVPEHAPDPINLVQILHQQQVMLEVRFLEVSRQASRELGVQWNMFSSHALANVGDQAIATQAPPAAGTQSSTPQPTAVQLPVTNALDAAGVLSGTAPFGFFVSQLFGGKNNLYASIDALEQKGLARSLAEPNLVALSGDTASFLAGGQFFVPVPQALGAVAFQPQSYGVGLSFTPTVLKDGLINLVIKPQVSELDTTHSVTIAGTTVPGLIMRQASTTLELRDGQSFMLGGLLQNNSNTAQDQLPWLGDVPVLGALFRSSQYQKNETDLVILVTPHVVRPLRPTDSLHTPLDNSLPANDIDFFLMGQAEVSPALVRLAAGAPNRPFVGHILDLPKQGGVYVSARD